jgi:hypothetical protein
MTEAIKIYAMYSLIVIVAWETYIISLMTVIFVVDYYVNRRK